jgi:ubiquinone/menaquinone biosynthesis C-methylase UbiE
MRADAICLEEARLEKIKTLEDYAMVHERHRVFPAVFGERQHRRVIDISAGVGVVGRRIKERYPCDLICNDMSPACLRLLQENGLKTTSFDLDAPDDRFPFPDDYFDAVVCLATIEHIIHLDHFLEELRRILRKGGSLYLSAPNYSGLPYLVPFLVTGRTFHNPLNSHERYEFFAHVRYFTYRTMLEYVGSKGFAPEAVYLPLPAESTKYQRLKSRSAAKAWLVRRGMQLIYRFGSPRWCSEPVLCLSKADTHTDCIPRKVIL